MFATVPHLSAGGWWRGKSPSSLLLFWRCSRINVIQQQPPIFFIFYFLQQQQQCCGKQSPAAVDSAVCSQSIPYVPQRKHIVSEFTANWDTISTCSFLLGLDKPLAVPDRTAYYCRQIGMGTFKVYASQRTLWIHRFSVAVCGSNAESGDQTITEITLLHQALKGLLNFSFLLLEYKQHL